jgi:hypothetical protein
MKALTSPIAVSLLLVVASGCAEQTPAVTPTTVTAPVEPDAGAAAAPAPVVPTSVDAAIASDVRAWFVLSPAKCPPSSPGTCYRVTLSLRGAVTDDRLVSKSYWSQTGCTAGANVECSGPSGTGRLSARCEASGACVVEAFSESDGYCPTNDCGSTVVVDRFEVPAGTRLVSGKP